MIESFIAIVPLFFFAAVNQVILPAPLDLFLVGLIKVGFHPLGVISVIVLGQLLGATFDFYVGKFGMKNIPFLKSRESTPSYLRARRFYDHYGKWSVLLGFLPFVGKYFPLVAGAMEARLIPVLLLYAIGKVLYYGFWWVAVFGTRLVQV